MPPTFEEVAAQLQRFDVDARRERMLHIVTREVPSDVCSQVIKFPPGARLLGVRNSPKDSKAVALIDALVVGEAIADGVEERPLHVVWMPVVQGEPLPPLQAYPEVNLAPLGFVDVLDVGGREVRFYLFTASPLLDGPLGDAISGLFGGGDVFKSFFGGR